MALLTNREYIEKKQKSQYTPLLFDKINEEVIINEYEYLLIYPENETGNYFTGIYKIDIDGKIIDVEIDNGKLITDKENIKDELLKKEFILLATRKKKKEK